MDTKRLGDSPLRALEKVPDPRSTHGRRHPLSAILALSVCAMAALRNLAVSVLRMRGEKNIAAAIRKIGWKPNGALHLLGLAPSG